MPDSLLCSNRVGGTWLNLIKDLICDKPTHYGNMGCQVSKGGIENQIDFWPRIKILERKIWNYFRKKCVAKIEVMN